MPLVRVTPATWKRPYLRLVKSARMEQPTMVRDRTKEARKRWRANARRIRTVLRKRGIASRKHLLSTRFDTWSIYTDIPGIGDVLGRQLRIMVNLYEQSEWEGVTGLPWSIDDEQSERGTG